MHTCMCPPPSTSGDPTQGEPGRPLTCSCIQGAGARIRCYCAHTPTAIPTPATADGGGWEGGGAAWCVGVGGGVWVGVLGNEGRTSTHKMAHLDTLHTHYTHCTHCTHYTHALYTITHIHTIIQAPPTWAPHVRQQHHGCSWHCG